MLLDTPIDEVSDTLEFLQDPLIPLPIEIETTIDEFSVGEYPADRWRDYIDVSKPLDPKSIHDKQMKTRIYAAKTIYELAIMRSCIGDDWVLKDTLDMIFNKSQIELRIIEFEIIGYQLLCGMIKFQGKHDDMYHANITLYFTLIKLIDYTGGETKQAKKIKNSVIKTKPGRTQTFKSLALNIDSLILAIIKILKNEIESTQSELLEKLYLLAKKLTECITSLDKVIIVVN